jgi:hypothetical protein
MKLSEILIALLLASAAASGQPSAAEHTVCTQRFADLTRQLAQLQMEVISYRLQASHNNVRTLETDLARIVTERRLAEQEEKANRDDVSSADVQLARSDLSEEERSELQSLRSALLVEGHAELRHRQNTAVERESAIRDQVARENAVIAGLEERLQTLQGAAPY